MPVGVRTLCSDYRTVWIGIRGRLNLLCLILDGHLVVSSCAVYFLYLVYAIYVCRLGRPYLVEVATSRWIVTIFSDWSHTVLDRLKRLFFCVFLNRLLYPICHIASRAQCRKIFFVFGRNVKISWDGAPNILDANLQRCPMHFRTQGIVTFWEPWSCEYFVWDERGLSGFNTVVLFEIDVIDAWLLLGSEILSLDYLFDEFDISVIYFGSSVHQGYSIPLLRVILLQGHPSHLQVLLLVILSWLALLRRLLFLQDLLY